MELIVGIISLLVAAMTLYVSIITYRYARMSDKKREEEEKQKLQDEYDALQQSLRVPFTKEQRGINIKKYVLEKQLKRKEYGRVEGI